MYIMNLITSINSKFYIIILIPFICNQFISNYSSNFTLINPYSITLENGNIFIIHKFGISLYDSNFSNVLTNISIFSEEEQIKNETDLSTIEYQYYDNYILCLIKYKLYIFNSEGGLLLKNDTILSEHLPKSFTLVAIGVKNIYYYYYLIGYFNRDNYLNFVLYKYDIDNNNTIFLTSEIYSQIEYFIYFKNYLFDFKNEGLSCQYIIRDRKNQLICFFIITNKKDDYFIEKYFSIYENKIESIEYLNSDCFIVGNVKQIKSEININRYLILVFITDFMNNVYIYKFNIMKNTYTLTLTNCKIVSKINYIMIF